MAMPKTLLELAVESLQENFHRYDSQHLQRILVPFHRVKEMMRASFHRKNHKLCEEGSKCNDRLYSALPLWIEFFHPREFAAFKLPICGKSDLSVTVFREFIRCLPLITPNVTKISFRAFAWNLSLGEREVNSIIKLTRLTWLLLDDVLTPLSGFLKIIDNCENLEYIFVDILIDVEMQSSFIRKGLVEFNSNLHEGRLKFVMGTKHPYKDEEDANLCMEPRNIAELKEVLKIHMHTPITIFQMFFEKLKDGDSLDQFPLFPYLKRAEFYLNSTVDDESLRVRQINSNWSMLRSFLRLNGRSLLHLKLSHFTPGQVTPEQLSGWCPNLKSLALGDYKIISENNVPIEQLLGQLHDIDWD